MILPAPPENPLEALLGISPTGRSAPGPGGFCCGLRPGVGATLPPEGLGAKTTDAVPGLLNG